MSFKLPELSRTSTLTDVLSASFQAELMAERASELGRTGEKVQKALARLADLPAGTGDPEERERRLDAAAAAVYTYFIQREVSGYRSHRDAIQFYQIPQSVLVRLGVSRPKTD